MRALRLLALAGTAALWAATAHAGDAYSYDLAPGDASYDALKAATDTCQAQGGALVLKDGEDATRLSSYRCVIGKGKDRR